MKLERTGHKLRGNSSLGTNCWCVSAGDYEDTKSPVREASALCDQEQEYLVRR